MAILLKNPRFVFLMILLPVLLYAQGKFTTSLHATRAGKGYWYNASTAAPQPGFESLTGVPIDHPNVACTSCHPGDNKDANGDDYPDPYPGAGCVDCHATKSGMTVSEDRCYGCHSRQKTAQATLGYTDVHKNGDNPFKCWDCHNKAELHGDDGVSYNSMLETGAITTACTNCHTSDKLPAGHAANDPHGGKLHCDACHVKSMVTCYNCHFESQVENHLKRAKQPIHDYVMLINREKDGKVGLANFQSLTYQGKSWVAFGPSHAHTVTEEGRKCAACHVNFGGDVTAIKQYNETGKIQFTTWNSADSTLSWIHGVIPFPADYQTSFKMDFLTYKGNTSDPVASSKNWEYIGKNTWDGHQLLFAKPLTKVQMFKLGMDTSKTTSVNGAQIYNAPQAHALKQNYPNPFNPSTTIEFDLPNTAAVSLHIYDATGAKKKALLFNQLLPAGTHQISFNGQELASGIYFYTLETKDFLTTKKMILIK